MAHIVLGIGTSHTPMLNAPLEVWPRFVERDRMRPHLSKAGEPRTYAELAAEADPAILKEITPEVFAQRHAAALAQVERLGEVIRAARLDTLIVVGDDQKELYHEGNMPSILLYHGETIRNLPISKYVGPDWARTASARYYEESEPRDYPVNAPLAKHLIDQLMDDDFDLAIADSLDEGLGEGHAFGFVHNRLVPGLPLPIVPIFLNTYFPPNQPKPARCFKLGQAIEKAVRAFPGDARVGVLASGGLSHFTVDEALDGRVMQALRDKDVAALQNLPLKQLNSGNSEIRNWICMAGATQHLALASMQYIPGYRSPAGTGTGMCFAHWH